MRKSMVALAVVTRSTPAQAFESQDRVRRDELDEIQRALSRMGRQVRADAQDDFILFPHPADPRGKSPPDWCEAEAAS